MSSVRIMEAIMFVNAGDIVVPDIGEVMVPKAET